MSPIKLTVHSCGSGRCSLSGKQEADGCVVSFEDGTVREAFLSFKALRQLLVMKAPQAAKPDPRPLPNGAPVVATPK